MRNQLLSPRKRLKKSRTDHPNMYSFITSSIYPTPLFQLDLYNYTLHYFQDTLPDSTLVCRESQIQQLFNIFQKIFKSNANLTNEDYFIRISGQSGTGKTYTIHHLLQQLERNTKYKKFLSHYWNPNICIINSAKIQNPQDLLKKIIQIILPFKDVKDFKLNNISYAFKQIQSLKGIHSNKTMILIIDEEDQLYEKSLGYSKNTLAAYHRVLSHLKSILSQFKLILINISNIHNSNITLNKDTKHNIIFQPYTEAELQCILNQRIEMAKNDLIKHKKYQNNKDTLLNYDIFEENSKLLTLKKIAYHSGDCRHLLNTCRQLIMENIYKINTSNINSPREIYPTLLNNNNYLDHDELSKSSEYQDIKMITLKNTADKFNSIFPSERLKCLNLIQNIPLHQQIIICSLCSLILEESTLSSQIPITTIQKIQMSYKATCEQYKIRTEYNTYSNLQEALNQLETMGIIRLNDKGKTKEYKKSVELLFETTDVCNILKGLKEIFSIWLE